MNHLYNRQSTKERRRELRKNSTEAERRVWRILSRKQMGARFFRQYSVGLYVLDFYCPVHRLAVEVDGGQHAEEANRKHDDERTQYLASQDIKVVRFGNNDVMQNLEGVWQKIKEELDKHGS
ncbi:endonuclease domain-containing protein [Candidatus Uhrbacteria bacterium]|nr:endonuclease domain-containing protein [Candidatus Uhrbacteria bacterium]